ncbi:hypothetical protein A3K64_01515 [Candidatus Micrarchaeota archaeon RBG_16_36_9]|nr:MAG: hypothetical protein A3K64_01515 [Candidatus Micrarchaeota archaeon RBG_16_36_9]
MIAHYNIHNLLKIKIITSNKGFFNYIDREFSFFKTGKISNPDITVTIEDFVPNLLHTNVINHKYFIRDNFLYCKDSYKVVKWEVQIEGINEKHTSIKFSGNYFSKGFLVSYIIEPLIRFKLEKKGYTFVHSSAISNGKESILFFACKGVGKTSTILNLIEKGFLYMSDDFTILSNKGFVYSYPTTIHMFGYNIRQCPFIYNRLRLKDKINIIFKDLIFKLSFRYASLPLNINVKDVFSDSEIGRVYPLKELIFLTKSTDARIDIKNNYDRESVAKQIISVNKLETFNFLDYMLAYESVFPESDLASHWSRSYKNLIKALNRKPVTKITISTEFPSKIIDHIIPKLSK